MIEWLKKTNEPRVFQVFDRVCNLINEVGEIISLVSKEIGAGPFSIVADIPGVSFTDFIGEGTIISIHHSNLHLGEITLNTTDTPLWQARYDISEINISFLKELVSSSILAKIKDFSTPNSLFSIFDPSVNLRTLDQFNVNRINSRIFSNAKTNGKILCDGILDNDLEKIQVGTKGLAGLGGGLTPAGDDFLLGIIFSNFLLYGVSESLIINREILRTASPLTTTLSRSWLIAAVKGEFDMKWHDLLEALSDQNIDNILIILKTISTHGHTSGSDAIAGFIYMLISYFNKST